jgi:threonylcarbamoyladenosine tRNA methylthiotransferase MtaB
MKEESIAFFTLGCRLNQSETAVIQQSFTVDGYKIVDIKEPADYVVINTCTVTENGDADTRRLVNRVSRINPQTNIALVGCQAQVQKEKLLDLPNVKWVVGNAKKMDIKSIIEELNEKDGQHVITPTIEKEPFTIPLAGIDTTHTRANIKIQDGCDFFCSFCEIPYARGRARSRVFDDIIKESKTLAEAGHKEIVLTGINVGTYANENFSLIDVITALEDIPKLERIRISSIEPTTIDDKIIQKMSSKESKLCRYLHIPIQSANNNVLELMKRKYTYEEFEQFILNVHSKVDDICIGTDVIVGFPGEEDSHFEETEERLRKLPIDYFHVFSYSQRNLAKSKSLTNPTPIGTIQSRSKILRDVSQRKRRMFYESLLGTTQKVLFEQEKNGYWNGLTDNYIRVRIRSNKDLENVFCAVTLDSFEDNTVIGRMIT